MKLMTTSELAEQIGVSRTTIWRWMKAGSLTSSGKVGNLEVFDAAGVAAAKALRDSDAGGRLTIYKPAADGWEYEPIADAAERVGVSMFTLRRWIQAGKVQGYRRGRQAVVLRVCDVDGLVAERASADDDSEPAASPIWPLAATPVAAAVHPKS
jgi:excisionase family DNA binding protein